MANRVTTCPNDNSTLVCINGKMNCDVCGYVHTSYPKYRTVEYTYTKPQLINTINQHNNGIHKLPLFYYNGILQQAQQHNILSII